MTQRREYTRRGCACAALLLVAALGCSSAREPVGDAASAPQQDAGPGLDAHSGAGGAANSLNDTATLDAGRGAAGSSEVHAKVDAGSTNSDAGGEHSGRTEVGSGSCAGAVAWPSLFETCTEASDCPSGNQCSPALMAPASCGSGCTGCFSDECKVDADCGGGVCVNEGQFGHTICVPHCKTSGCIEGKRCESDGRCQIQPCDEGFDCGPTRRCRPTPENAAQNGCETIPCTDPAHPGCPVNERCSNTGNCGALSCKRSSDCDCGACLNASGGSGLCAASIGVCQPPPVVCNVP